MTLVVTSTDLMFRKIFELLLFDKLHPEMNLVLKEVMMIFVCGVFKHLSAETYCKF